MSFIYFICWFAIGISSSNLEEIVSTTELTIDGPIPVDLSTFAATPAFSEKVTVTQVDGTTKESNQNNVIVTETEIATEDPNQNNVTVTVTEIKGITENLTTETATEEPEIEGTTEKSNKINETVSEIDVTAKVATEESNQNNITVNEIKGITQITTEEPNQISTTFTEIDGIPNEDQHYVRVTEIDGTTKITTENPDQNKVIITEIKGITEISTTETATKEPYLRNSFIAESEGTPEESKQIKVNVTEIDGTGKITTKESNQSNVTVTEFDGITEMATDKTDGRTKIASEDLNQNNATVTEIKGITQTTTTAIATEKLNQINVTVAEIKLTTEESNQISVMITEIERTTEDRVTEAMQLNMTTTQLPVTDTQANEINSGEIEISFIDSKIKANASVEYEPEVNNMVTQIETEASTNIEGTVKSPTFVTTTENQFTKENKAKQLHISETVTSVNGINRTSIEVSFTESTIKENDAVELASTVHNIVNEIATKEPDQTKLLFTERTGESQTYISTSLNENKVTFVQNTTVKNIAIELEVNKTVTEEPNQTNKTFTNIMATELPVTNTPILNKTLEVAEVTAVAGTGLTTIAAIEASKINEPNQTNEEDSAHISATVSNTTQVLLESSFASMDSVIQHNSTLNLLTLNRNANRSFEEVVQKHNETISIAAGSENNLGLDQNIQYGAEDATRTPMTTNSLRKLHLECKTDRGPDPGQNCAFPFWYHGKLFNECTFSAEIDDAWCSTEVDSQNRYITNRWGFCNNDCPKQRSNCVTIGPPGKEDLPCIFPFHYMHMMFWSCTSLPSPGSGDSTPWCPTALDDHQDVLKDNWGYCARECLGSGDILIESPLYFDSATLERQDKVTNSFKSVSLPTEIPTALNETNMNAKEMSNNPATDANMIATEVSTFASQEFRNTTEIPKALNVTVVTDPNTILTELSTVTNQEFMNTTKVVLVQLVTDDKLYNQTNMSTTEITEVATFENETNINNTNIQEFITIANRTDMNTTIMIKNESSTLKTENLNKTVSDKIASDTNISTIVTEYSQGVLNETFDSVTQRVVTVEAETKPTTETSGTEESHPHSIATEATHKVTLTLKDEMDITTNVAPITDLPKLTDNPLATPNVSEITNSPEIISTGQTIKMCGKPEEMPPQDSVLYIPSGCWNPLHEMVGVINWKS